MAELTAGDCPSPWGEPVATARLKAGPEDFVVEEVLGFAPDGDGEHLWLWVEKRGLNTDFVAGELAARLGLKLQDVSYSGLKDRHALTRQWFSAHWPAGAGTPAAGCWTAGDGWIEVPARDPGHAPGSYRVLAQQRSGRKLRRGAHAANRFVITLRDVQGDDAAIQARLDDIGRGGVANYFGAQRFGHGGRNVDQGLALLAERRAGQGRSRGRQQRGRRDNRESIWLSAVRSALFNRVLAERVRDGSWCRCLPGDVLQLDGRGSFFVPEPGDAALPARLAAGEVHPTGPLPGDGASVVTDDVAALEAGVLAPWEDICADLAALRVPGQRRSLRLRVDDLVRQQPQPDVLVLSFTLAAGSFATAVLASLARLHEDVPVAASPAVAPGSEGGADEVPAEQ